ncbi:MAG: biotin--[acetyl-CoA-carboxylase] ligase [Thermodesulfovibrionales bacterium]
MPDSLLRLLKQHDGFVSGEQLSRTLGISRAAVWKKIRALRSRGCVIESLPSRGYSLKKTPDLFGETLAEALRGSFWRDVRVLDSVDSTNDLCIEIAREGLPSGGLLLAADSQRKGKGRLGRVWASPGGMNVHMSLLFRPALPPRDAPMLTFLAAVAAAETLRALCGMPVEIKWPNDLLVGEKKLGGILTEVRSDPDRILFAVVGVGINVNMRRTALPSALRKTATSVRIETGRDFPRNDLIAALALGFERWLTVISGGGRDRLLDAWKGLSSTIGRDVEIRSGNEIITGNVQDIDENGLLVLRAYNGTVRKVSVGDVTQLRRTATP